jgi:hypothetical protein
MRLFWHSRKPADAWLDIAPRLKNLGLKVIALYLTEDDLSFDILDRSDPNRSYGIHWSRNDPTSDLIRDLNRAMGELHVNVKWKYV